MLRTRLLRVPCKPSAPRRFATRVQPATALPSPRAPRNPALGSSCPTQLNTSKIPSPTNTRSQQISAHFSSSPSSALKDQTVKMATTGASLPTRGGYDPKAASTFTARKVGAPHTLEHRIYVEKDGVPLSPFHDIPLYANEQQTVLNMIVEIPRWTNAKQEVRLPHVSTSTH